MKWGSLWKEAALSAALLAGWAAGSHFFLQRMSQEDHQKMAHRLARPVEILLQKAHQAKDDLAMQDVIQALAQAPGITVACVVDRQNLILASSQLSQLGKPLSSAPHSRRWNRYPLQEGQDSWGTLLFSLSNRSAQKRWNSQRLALGSGATLLWVVFMARSIVGRRDRIRLEAAVRKEQACLQEEREAKARLERQNRELSQSFALGCQGLLDQIPRACVFLDKRQRVLAANRLAAERLDVSFKDGLTGCSWQDLSSLQGLGHFLEASLQSPGKAIQTETQNIEGIAFCTLTTGHNQIVGTLVTFLSRQ